MNYYHASPTGGITQLKPHISNHGMNNDNLYVIMANGDNTSVIQLNET